MDILISVTSFVIILGVIIFMHELGHFIAARLCKIRVEIFSLGFGKRLWGFERNGVDYRISLIPLGGYLKMAGEHIGEARSGAPNEYLSHPRYQRALVSLAGPLMNLALAVVLLTANNIIGVDMPGFTREAAMIGDINAGSAAQQAGLEVGDLIQSLGGSPVADWREFQMAAISFSNETTSMEIRRGDDILEKTITIDENLQDPYLITGIRPFIPAKVGEVINGFPAAEAGLQNGDLIQSVSDGKTTAEGYYGVFKKIYNHPGAKLQLHIRRGEKTITLDTQPSAAVTEVTEGSPAALMGLEKSDVLVSVSDGQAVVTDFFEMITTIRNAGDIDLTLTVRRDEELVELKARSDLIESDDMFSSEFKDLKFESKYFKVRGVLGFIFDFDYFTEQFSFFDAIKKSFRDNYDLVVLTVRILGKVIRGELSLKQFQGPIGIAQATGEVVKTRKLTIIFGFSALISMNLAVLNLLPIPVLDGGMLFLLLIEMILRRDLPLRLKERAIQIGFILLVTFMLIVIVFDIIRSVGGT